MHHHHSSALVVLSVVIAIFASYTALDLANSVAISRGRARLAWLAGGSMAMGVGIWSMHFIAMLAFYVPGLAIAYHVPLLFLSIAVAIAASAIALYVVSRPVVTITAYGIGSLSMGAAIAGMHYIGIASMRMAARIEWNDWLVLASILIAITASFAALSVAFRLRHDLSKIGFFFRGAAGVLMGIAIAGMHYTAMAAMTLVPAASAPFRSQEVLATSGLAVSVIGTTMLILGIALTGSVVDRALARRAAMTDRIAAILESISDAFFSVDPSWRFTYVNRVAQDAIRDLHGEMPSDLHGRSLWENVPEMRGTRLERECRRCMSEGAPALVEEYFRSSDQWLEAHVYPSAEGLSVYFRDVTYRKRYEHALREAVRSRDEFISICSHELKTPVTTLKLQFQMASREIAQSHRNGAERSDWRAQRDFLAKRIEMGIRQIDRLGRLIDDMLDVSRIATGKLTLQIKRTDLSEVVREVFERFAEQFRATGSHVRLREEGSVYVECDRLRIEQVITNLISNALKYGEGKPIEVLLSREKGDRVEIRVRDRGMGISREDLGRIFDRYVRAVGGSDIAGLGLGLYISRQIAEAHGGTIRAESEIGKGSLFVLKLPVSQAKRSAA